MIKSPMKSRVTITLDPVVLEQARTQARLRGVSLSALIEDRLKQALQHSLKANLSFTKNGSVS
jgi:predicted HicB family RNase H-like nuclease